MRVIYLIDSIAGWIALAVLLAFIAAMHLYRRRRPAPPPAPDTEQQHP